MTCCCFLCPNTVLVTHYYSWIPFILGIAGDPTPDKGYVTPHHNPMVTAVNHHPLNAKGGHHGVEGDDDEVPPCRSQRR